VTSARIGAALASMPGKMIAEIDIFSKNCLGKYGFVAAAVFVNCL